MAQFDQMKFLYQPVVSRETRAIACGEATLMWSQDESIQVGEALEATLETGQMRNRTGFIINQLVADLPRLKRMYGVSCGVSFVFPERVIQDPAIVDIAQRALTAHNADPADLTIGISLEGHDFSESVVATLQKLRASGALVMLGQFGTGLLTLGSLSAVPFDILKVDRQLVQRMVAHKPTHSVIAAIAAFCEDSGTSLVADGVDDAMILNELEPFGSMGVQGALFGDPVAIDELRPAVQQPFVLQTVESAKRIEASPERIDSLRARINDLDPRAFKMGFPDFLAKAEEVKLELRGLSFADEREFACLLGQQVTIAAVYAGENIASLDWGLETSNLAEDLGHLGVSAEMLALISTVPATTESSRFVRVEALSRALQIRSTTELEPAESGILDNILAMALAYMGLVDRAVLWWAKLIREHEDLDLPGHTYASMILAEVELARLEDRGFNGSAVVRETSARRIERAVARATRSQYPPPGVSETLQVRQALLHGDLHTAHELIEPWLADTPAAAVPAFFVLKARALVARESGQPLAYLRHTTELIETVGDDAILRVHRSQMHILHIDSLSLAGRLDEALQAQRSLLDYETALGRSRASSMFDWMQIRADVDLQFAHYADLVRHPEAVKRDS